MPTSTPESVLPVSSWIQGLPPAHVQVAWLRLQPGPTCQFADEPGSMLCVRDEENAWSEAGDWKGASVTDLDPVEKLGYLITGWLPFSVPQP